jgi:hypothetical protein
VKKALASAWLAAIAVHTALVRPEMRQPALDFFDARERALYASARAQAADFARAAAAETDHPFWVARANAAEGVEPEDGLDAAALARDPDVLRAFERLRAGPSVRFRTGAGLQRESRAAVRGREIVMDDHLVLPGCAQSVRYLRNVDLISLVRLAVAHHDVGDLIEAFTRAHGPLPLPDILGALATLVAKGGLEYEGVV